MLTSRAHITVRWQHFFSPFELLKEHAIHVLIRTVWVGILGSLGLLDPLGLQALRTRFGFDCSVGVANASGDRRDRAAHWGGLSEAQVVDRPGSVRLLPENWGTVVLR